MPGLVSFSGEFYSEGRGGRTIFVLVVRTEFSTVLSAWRDAESSLVGSFPGSALSPSFALRTPELWLSGELGGEDNQLMCD